MKKNENNNNINNEIRDNNNEDKKSEIYVPALSIIVDKDYQLSNSREVKQIETNNNEEDNKEKENEKSIEFSIAFASKISQIGENNENIDIDNMKDDGNDKVIECKKNVNPVKPTIMSITDIKQSKNNEEISQNKKNEEYLNYAKDEEKIFNLLNSKLSMNESLMKSNIQTKDNNFVVNNSLLQLINKS